MLAVARSYAAQGWSIIPQRAGGKKPRVRWKPYQEVHPTDAEITGWWTWWPDAGICLILGPVSGVVAVDVDSPEAEKIFFDLVGCEPKTRKTLSGSRKPSKAHFLFRCPEFPTAAKYTPLHKKLEFRGHRGYVVLPPSLHESGHRYAWDDPATEIVELPPTLAEVWKNNPRFQVRSTTSRREPIVAYNKTPGPVVESATPQSLLSLLRLIGIAPFTRDWLLGRYAHSDNWNQRLFIAACDLAGHGLSLATAEPFLLRGAQPDTSADDQAARRTIQSAFSQARRPLADISGQVRADEGQSDPQPDGGSTIRIIRPRRMSHTLRVEG